MVFAASMSAVQFSFMLGVAAFMAGCIPLVLAMDWLYRERHHLPDRLSPRIRKLLRLVMLEFCSIGCAFALLSLVENDVLPQWEGAFHLGFLGAALVAAAAFLAFMRRLFPGLFWLMLGR